MALNQKSFQEKEYGEMLSRQSNPEDTDYTIYSSNGYNLSDISDFDLNE